MAYATEAEWIAAQPNTTGMTPMESKVALESWQVQRPGYVNPMDYQTYEQYAGAAGIQSGKDEGNDLQNRANFYGLTIENYLNALKTGEGSAGNLTGSQLLSPLERIAAETARAQGIGTMSPEVAALAKANPDVFNAAAQKWSNYFKTTYPGSLEYESVLAGPAKYSATGVTMPTTSTSNSMYLLDPTTKQITKNPNYNPTPLSTGAMGGTAGGLIAGGTGTTGGAGGGMPGSVIAGGAGAAGQMQGGLLGQTGAMGRYTGSIDPVTQSYLNYMAIPTGIQWNPAMTPGGQSPYEILKSRYPIMQNPYEGQMPYTSMGGYDPRLYVDLAKENKRMADIAAANAYQEQLRVLAQGGGDANGGDTAGIGSQGGDAAGNTGGGPGTGADGDAAFANGGMVNTLLGPNPPGPDDGAGFLDRGEYVIKKSAVNKYGKGLLDMINDGKVPAKKMKSLLG